MGRKGLQSVQARGLPVPGRKLQGAHTLSGCSPQLQTYRDGGPGVLRPVAIQIGGGPVPVLGQHQACVLACANGYNVCNEGNLQPPVFGLSACSWALLAKNEAMNVNTEESCVLALVTPGLCAGLRQGLEGMRVGGKRSFIVPP
eukprot:1161793-Pelagomonas_calceolata.AAC.7